MFSIDKVTYQSRSDSMYLNQPGPDQLTTRMI